MAASIAPAQDAAPDRIAIGREPFLPPPDKWNAVYAKLCGHCRRQPDCGLPRAMMDFAYGRGGWPDEAWVTDPGAGCTCLSYVPKPVQKISPDQARALALTPEEDLPHVCGGCAARKGSEASVALHTQRDYRAAVQDGSVFTCHEDPENKRLCGGWCRAVRRREA